MTATLRERLEAHAAACREAMAQGRTRPACPADILTELRSARANLAGANLAGANLADANLAGADLAGAYLAGADLADANLADANLAGADLAGADLADANLAGANLARANLADADLAGAYLAGADLADANLARAKNVPPSEAPTGQSRAEWLAQRCKTAQERAARYRERHPDVPVVERIDSKILEAVTTGGGTLDMSSWHRCETTHCIAGWAVQLAGKAGLDLEAQTDTARAGAAIYRASKGMAPHFYATTEQALSDLRERAAAEVAP